jgi:hypothetical protein
MAADGAVLGRLLGFQNIAAVQAHPGALALGGEEAALLHGLGKGLKAAAVGGFDGGDLPEGVGDLVEAFLFGGFGKGGIDGFGLLKLVVGRPAQQIADVVGDVHGVAAVDVDGLAGGLLHKVVEQLRVFLLLPGGKGEDLGEGVKLLGAAERGGKGVAVAGLGFPGKGAHQVFQGFTFFDMHIVLLQLDLQIGCGARSVFMQKKKGRAAQAARPFLQCKWRGERKREKREKILT